MLMAGAVFKIIIVWISSASDVHLKAKLNASIEAEISSQTLMRAEDALLVAVSIGSCL